MKTYWLCGEDEYHQSRVGVSLMTESTERLNNNNGLGDQYINHQPYSNSPSSQKGSCEFGCCLPIEQHFLLLCASSNINILIINGSTFHLFKQFYLQKPFKVLCWYDSPIPGKINVNFLTPSTVWNKISENQTCSHVQDKAFFDLFHPIPSSEQKLQIIWKSAETSVWSLSIQSESDGQISHTGFPVKKEGLKIGISYCYAPAAVCKINNASVPLKNGNKELVSEKGLKEGYVSYKIPYTGL